jgi:predicted nucleic acid-binding protein
LIVLDTSFIVDLLRGRERAQEMLFRLEDEGESVCTTSINVLELYRGAFLSKRSSGLYPPCFEPVECLWATWMRP